MMLCPIRIVNIDIDLNSDIISDRSIKTREYKSNKESAFTSLIAGAVAGVVSRTLTAPIDRLK